MIFFKYVKNYINLYLFDTLLNCLGLPEVTNKQKIKIQLIAQK